MHLGFRLSPLLAIATALAVLPAVSAAGPPATASATCSNSVKLRAYEIKTVGASCSTAKRTVIPQWNKKCARHMTRRCTLASGYTCKGTFDGYEGVTVKCTKGTRRVRWLTT
jgi:hypothetical protein